MEEIKTKNITHISDDLSLVEGSVTRVDVVEDFKYLQHKEDIALVVPIAITGGKVRYLMSDKMRPAALSHSLEFPTISCKSHEKAKAASDLLEKMGVQGKLKFIYSMYSSISSSSRVVSVYIAILPEGAHPCEGEMIDADLLLRKVQENEIRDSHTLAALTAVMMQSGEAKRYLNDLDGQGE